MCGRPGQSGHSAPQPDVLFAGPARPIPGCGRIDSPQRELVHELDVRPLRSYQRPSLKRQSMAIRKLNNGRWEASYRDPAGREKIKRHRTRAEADRWLAAMKSNIA